MWFFWMRQSIYLYMYRYAFLSRNILRRNSLWAGQILEPKIIFKISSSWRRYHDTDTNWPPKLPDFKAYLYSLTLIYLWSVMILGVLILVRCIIWHLNGQISDYTYTPKPEYEPPVTRVDTLKAVKFFSKLNYFIFGYFEPTNIFFDNKNK